MGATAAQFTRTIALRKQHHSVTIIIDADGVTLHHANALALPLPDASVDLIVTSPPYFALRAYTDGGDAYEGQIGAEATPEEFLDALVAATREMVRVLKPTGSIWVNLGDKYAGSNGQSGGGGKSTLAGAANARPRGEQQVPARGGFVPTTSVRAKSLIGIPWRYAIRCIDDLGLILRAEVIWSKPNALPESVTDRVRRSHEQWFHFTNEPRYFATMDEIREKYAHEESPTARRGPSGQNRGTATGRTHDDGAPVSNFTHNALGKLPGSVWTVATEPLKVPESLGVDHFAAFPTEWPRRIILGWSPPDGVVLDPFCGTGTTIAVARALGRHGIGTDLSRDYLRLAAWRCVGDGFNRVQAKVLRMGPAKKPAVDAVALF